MIDSAYVQRGPEIIMTPADDLLLRFKLQENKMAVANT